MRIVPGSHAFVDENMARGFLMAASYIPADGLGEARKALRGLLLRGQERLHFRHERDDRRRQIVDRIGTLPLKVRLYGSDAKDMRQARRICLAAIAADAIVARAEWLVIEMDEPSVHSDRQVVSSVAWHAQHALKHRHLLAKAEPLLWVSDAVAWCEYRGGEWARRVASVVAGRTML